MVVEVPVTDIVDMIFIENVRVVNVHVVNKNNNFQEYIFAEIEHIMNWAIPQCSRNQSHVNSLLVLFRNVRS